MFFSSPTIVILIFLFSVFSSVEFSAAPPYAAVYDHSGATSFHQYPYYDNILTQSDNDEQKKDVFLSICNNAPSGRSGELRSDSGRIPQKEMQQSSAGIVPDQGNAKGLH